MSVVYWSEISSGIDVHCEVTYIRPYVKFLVTNRVDGEDAFENLDTLISGVDRYNYRNRYHKACINAFISGCMNSVIYSEIYLCAMHVQKNKLVY